MPGVDHDAIADGEPVDAWAERFHHARAVRAQDARLRHGREPHAHPDVEMVERRGRQPDQHLALRRLRIGHVLVPQHVRAAVLVDPNRLHGHNPLMTAAELAQLGRGARPRRRRGGSGRAVRGDRAAHPRAARARPLRRHEVHDGPARGLLSPGAAARRVPAPSSRRRSATGPTGPSRARRGAAAAVRLARPLRAPARAARRARAAARRLRTACSSTRTSTSTARRRARAGVGFYGKNTMLITRRHGSWVVLGTLVTDVELEPTAPLDLDCGDCRLCIDACPTGALDEPGVLDANAASRTGRRRPRPIPEAYREELGRVGVRLRHLPGRVPVEPRRREAARAALPLPEDATPNVSLVDWLARDGADLVAELDRLYVPQNDPRWLRRNALVALGNVGGGRRGRWPSVRSAESDDPILADAAAWATGADRRACDDEPRPARGARTRAAKPGRGARGDRRGVPRCGRRQAATAARARGRGRRRLERLLADAVPGSLRLQRRRSVIVDEAAETRRRSEGHGRRAPRRAGLARRRRPAAAAAGARQPDRERASATRRPGAGHRVDGHAEGGACRDRGQRRRRGHRPQPIRRASSSLACG